MAIQERTSQHTPPFTLEQIGTGAVRFPSGAPMPAASDSAVDPYYTTRIPKEVQVEGILFWPQIQQTFPGLVLLHEFWGLNEQIKNLAYRLACEGYVVLVPNLYGRQGGMVTANREVAEALFSRIKEPDVLQDINSCCEFLNTRDHCKRNVHGAVGFGLGGFLALQFAGHRRRLRSAVSFYGKIPTTADNIQNLNCPLLYHQAAEDDWASPEDVERLRQAAHEHSKKVEIHSYPGTRHAFCNETRSEVYNPEAARNAWDTTVEFLSSSFTGT